MFTQERRIDDYWNIDGSRDLSHSWTGFTQFTLLEEKPPDGYVWSRERLTKRQATSRPDHLWPELWIKMGRNAELKERQNGPMKNRNSIMPEDYEEFTTLTLRTRNSKKPVRMLARDWKHRWLLPCLARQARKVSMGRSVVRLLVSSLKLRVSWKPVNPQDCVWKNLYRTIMRTKLQERGDNALQHYNLVHKFILMPQTMKIPAAKAAVDKEWEKLEKIPAWDLTKVRSKSEVIDAARTKARKFILPH